MQNKVRKKLDLFFSNYQSQKFKKGEILIKADEPPSSIYYLKKGIVKRYAISPSGEELVLNIFRAPSFFPMSYALNNESNYHYFEAMTIVSTLKAPNEDVLKFLKKNQDVLFDLLSRVYKGMEGLLLRMESLLSGNARSQLITELIIYAKRFGEKNREGTLINLKVTENNLASQSGIRRETVSREIKKLKQKGLISYQKSILVINDLKKLEEELTK